MADVYIDTTQNVQIRYNTAGIGYRLLSNLLDLVFMLVYSWIMDLFTGWSQSFSFENPWLLILLILPLNLYHLISETLLNGQTLGMKIMRTKVVRLDGTPPDITSYFLRWVFRIIDVYLVFGLPIPSILCIAVSEKGQRWGDMAADTTVVRLTQRTALQDTILNVNQAKRDLVFTQVNLLSDRDVGITKDVYLMCSKSNNYVALAQLAAKLKERMQVESKMDDKTFIETVIADYNSYQFE
jgi:uncharacterized RDD family membrane protein YckC